jgi:hypothetical protein
MAAAGWKSAKQRKAKKAVAILVARSLLQQLPSGQPRRRGRCGAQTATRSRRAGAFGALAVGALSVGAGALGALAIGKLTIRRAAIGSLRVQELTVGRLRVEELEVRSRTGAGV